MRSLTEDYAALDGVIALEALRWTRCCLLSTYLLILDAEWTRGGVEIAVPTLVARNLPKVRRCFFLRWGFARTYRFIGTVEDYEVVQVEK